MIPFAEFAPDQPRLESGASGHVLNVVPLTAQSYGPLPALTPIGDALNARCQGAASFRGPDGTIFNVAGDATKLYRWDGTHWNDVSRISGPYATAADQGWSFAQFGGNVIAVNGIDQPQVFAIASPSPFNALPGAPAARFAATVRDFAMLGQLVTDQSAVHWSGLNDINSWAPGTNQSDNQAFPDGGRVTGIVGGQYAVIFQETAIRRGTYVGPDLIFQFDPISTERGCAASGSIASYQQLVFFLAADGFFLLSGGETERPIGDQKVDAWFRANVNETYLHRITAAIDPSRKLYVVAFPSAESGTGAPDTLLIYNWTIDRWSRAEVDVEILCRMMNKLGQTMDSLDAIYPNLDAIPLSLDSALLTGSPLAKLGAFGADRRMAFFEGSNLAAEIDTIEAQIAPGGRSFVGGIRPLVDGGTLAVQIGARERSNDPVVWSGEVAQNVIGSCPLRSSARYHRARVKVGAGGQWSHAQGVDLEAVEEGTR
ncbi:MAG: hypothetical protein ACREEP_21050 [Dongiaceae bacterium]